MRTSLNEIKAIDDHLMGLTSPGDALVFEAKTIVDKQLHQKVAHQQRVYTLVQQYGRKNLKAEIEAVHQHLFNNPARYSLVNKILALFKK